MDTVVPAFGSCAAKPFFMLNLYRLPQVRPSSKPTLSPIGGHTREQVEAKTARCMPGFGLKRYQRNTRCCGQNAGMHFFAWFSAAPHLIWIVALAERARRYMRAGRLRVPTADFRRHLFVNIDSVNEVPLQIGATLSVGFVTLVQAVLCCSHEGSRTSTFTSVAKGT